MASSKKTNVFFVFNLAVQAELNPNTFELTDILLAFAEKLHKATQEHKINIHSVYLEQLNSWSAIKIIEEKAFEKEESDRSIEGKAGIHTSFFALLGKWSERLRAGTEDSTLLRKTFNNYFQSFAEYFNTYLLAVEEAFIAKGFSGGILFFVDEMDKIDFKRAEYVLEERYNLIKKIHTKIIFTLNIQLLYQSKHFDSRYEVFKLPMIKVYEQNGEKHEANYSYLKEVLYRRVSKRFLPEASAEKLIEYSGGCFIELMKLLSDVASATTANEEEVIQIRHVEEVAQDTSIVFKRVAEHHPGIYDVIAKVDLNIDREHSELEIENKALYNLFILEYNSYWRKSHPCVRLLKEYHKSIEKFNG